MLVSVYVDESCLGNGREGDNPGGAGGLIEARGADGLIVRRDFWIAEPSTTNNRAGLGAQRRPDREPRTLAGARERHPRRRPPGRVALGPRPRWPSPKRIREP